MDNVEEEDKESVMIVTGQSEVDTSWVNAMNASDKRHSVTAPITDTVALIEFSPVTRRLTSTHTRDSQPSSSAAASRSSREAIIKVTLDDDPSSPPIYI